MKPGNRLNMRLWVGLDLLVLALMVCVAAGAYVISTGAWSPSPLITLDYWPLIAFCLWLIVALAGGLLVFCQLTAIDASRAAAHPHPTPTPSPAARPRTAPAQLTVKAVHTRPSEPPVLTDTAVDLTEAEEAEPELVGVGR
jgi:hypothetical protein